MRPFCHNRLQTLRGFDKMGATAEKALAKLAGRQRGLATAAQLHALGFDNSAIKRRLGVGRLHKVHRSVYLVGHSVAPPYAAELAAVLACGPGSVVSHRSAPRLWRLAVFDDWTGPVELTNSNRDLRNRPGIRIYRVALETRDVRRVHGIPVTAPARTLLDLAAVVPMSDLEAAYADARARRLVRERDLSALLKRSVGRRGARALRLLLETCGEHGLTRSAAERKCLALIGAAGLPVPIVNTRVPGFEVDFLWPTEKVILEVDGYAFHSGRSSFEQDRDRDTKLAARGYVVLRITWRQLTEQHTTVIARLAATLAVRSGRA